MAATRALLSHQIKKARLTPAPFLFQFCVLFLFLRFGMLTMAQRFGDVHTDQKLNKLEAYLKVYSTALRNQNFYLIYFDAFAGAGDIQIGSKEATLLDAVDEYSPFIAGSPLRALKFGKAFDRYIFVDNKKGNVEALKALKEKYAN